MSLQDADDREWRRIQREENRAASRGDMPSRPTDATSMSTYPATAVRSVPTAPERAMPAAPARPAPANPKPRPEPNAGSRPASAFRIVDELPPEVTGRRLPEQRAELIVFAKANPGKWIEYRSTPADPIKKASYFAANVRAGKCGFDPKGSFEAVTRSEVPYIRYVGTNRGELQ